MQKGDPRDSFFYPYTHDTFLLYYQLQFIVLISMSAPVLLNLVNRLKKSNKMPGLQSIITFLQQV